MQPNKNILHYWNQNDQIITKLNNYNYHLNLS